jgi:hypothetical protein
MHQALKVTSHVPMRSTVSVRAPDDDGGAFVSWGSEGSPAPPVPVAWQTAERPVWRTSHLPLAAAAALVGAAVVAVIIAVTGSSSPGPSNGVAGMAPAAIVTAAANAIGSASSFRVSGSGQDNGRPVALDLELQSGQGAEGTVTENGASFQIVVIGGALYMKAAAASWQHVSGTAAAQLLAGKWLQLSTGGQYASLASLANGPALFEKLLSKKGTFAKGSTSTLDGQGVVALQEPSTNTTLYVATNGPAYPVELTQPGTQGGTIVFDRINQPVQISPPPNPVNMSQLIPGSS